MNPMVLLAFISTWVLAGNDPTVILVDKKTNSLSVAYYKDDGYQTIKKFRATIGQVRGDKWDEGDLKTPEGVYFFNNYLTPPALKPKFGSMAFYVTYPNAFDRLSGNTGYSIMLHATNDPDRLKRDYDSEGCVVVDNADIAQIKPYIRLGLTPVLIFSDMTESYRRPASDSEVGSFFRDWLTAWESKDLDTYIGSYHSEFVSAGKNLKEWRVYKAALNEKYDTIKVQPEHIQFFKHPKYTMITFVQNYVSTPSEKAKKSGGTGFKSHGTKILYVARENGQPRIVDEDYTALTW